MRKIKTACFCMAAALLMYLPGGCSDGSKGCNAEAPRIIVTSDTILSGMVASLLPRHRYYVEAILPPGQCPGHYDVKFSDIEKMKKADLLVAFKGMPYLDKAKSSGAAQLLVDTQGRNWMAPDSYLYGLTVLGDRLSERYPEDKDRIGVTRKEVIDRLRLETNALKARIERAGIGGRAVIASSLQKEVLQWMGFQIVGEYGRPETISAREIVRLSKIGRDRRVILVVDNLQSGPDAGKGVAETLGVPHVVLTNFPSEKGYLATLRENVDTVLSALRRE